MAGYSFQMVPIILLGSLLSNLLGRYSKLIIYALTDIIQGIILLVIWFYISVVNIASSSVPQVQSEFYQIQDDSV